ncbi:MAG TPA: carbohydrate kinase family protein [Terracidiphilus sp.]|jgi:sugar/nucleoside kinase (ribokinase family)|nr:carbohydrate kinase family protein [Terracidiphilus sp.]
MGKRFDVTIAGETNLDLILYGLPEQMAVERELLADDFRMTLGSSSAIVAHNLAALGVSVGFITRLGDDALGKLALERLAEKGVDLSHVKKVERGTSTGVTILLHHGARRHILTYPGTMFEMNAGDLDMDYLASGRHFHLSSLFLHKALQPDLPRIFRTLKSAGLTLSLDTNDDPEDRWQAGLDELLDLVHIFLPNEDEALRITGAADVETAASTLARRVPIVVIKCGKRGALVRTSEQQWMVPAELVTPVDTIGAGDSFNAGFLSAWLRGEPLESCAAFGNRTAALSTLRSGGTESFRDPDLLGTLSAQRS